MYIIERGMLLKLQHSNVQTNMIQAYNKHKLEKHIMHN